MNKQKKHYKSTINKLYKKILSVGFGCFTAAASYGAAPYLPFGATLNVGTPLPPASQRGPKQKFSPAEDERLRALVDELGTDDWKLIASHMPGRTGRQCRDRWFNYLAPNLNFSVWTPEEDAFLAQKVDELSCKWDLIAGLLPGRSGQHCKNRWHLFQRREQKKQQPIATEPPISSPPALPPAPLLLPPLHPDFEAFFDAMFHDAISHPTPPSLPLI
ncbi:MAG: hypothetical protein LBF34_01130 [Puniceicoccales bacterium]|nr:hypothetical protein [Puniceicoccales bacterium]